MSIRVNLIRPTELRYQGVVSKTFLVRVSAITALVLAALLLMSALIRYQALRMNLTGSRHRWEQVAPAYTNVTAMQQEVVRNRALLAELKGWSNSRIDWTGPLADLRGLVPVSVQLVRLIVTGSIDIKKTAAPAVGKPKAAMEPPKGGEAPSEVASAAKQAPAPTRKFTINMEGRAVDKLADQVVVEFVNQLRKADSFKSILEFIKLQGIRLDTGSNEERAGERIFSIEAATKPRDVK